MNESYTPREIIDNINSQNPEGVKFDPYDTEEKLGRILHQRALLGKDLFATSLEEITQEKIDAELEKERVKEEKMADAKQSLQNFYDYLKNHGIADETIATRIGELEVYYDDNSDSAVIERTDRKPLVLDLLNLELTGELTIPEQMRVSTIDISWNKITSISYLPEGLAVLRCPDNKISKLPDLPMSLEELDCALNEIENLPELPDGLSNINCNGNILTSLPKLPPDLEVLRAHRNNLSFLPELPDKLTILSCSTNSITELPDLPPNLSLLECAENQLTSLPNLPVSIKNIFCQSNRLKQLPDLPEKLSKIDCSNNDLSALPAIPKSLMSLICLGNRLTRGAKKKLLEQKEEIKFDLKI